jgi:hypothetical protein
MVMVMGSVCVVAWCGDPGHDRGTQGELSEWDPGVAPGGVAALLGARRHTHPGPGRRGDIDGSGSKWWSNSYRINKSNVGDALTQYSSIVRSFRPIVA